MRRPLRVLHVEPAREWRGGQNQVRLLVRALARRSDGPRQALLTRDGSELEAAVRREVPAVELRPVPWGPALDPRAVLRLASAAPEFDLLHAHSAHALQASVLALALSGGGAGLVASRRSTGGVRSPAVWRRADLVLAISEAVRRDLVADGLERARLRVVPSGVDPEEHRPGDPDRLRRAAAATAGVAAGTAGGAPLVGTAGALTAEKDHATFVRAAALLARERADVRFVVAGEGPERERLEALVCREGLAGRLALPGHVPDVGRCLGDLDLFVLTSRREGLGTVLLEALASGTPAVVTRTGGAVEVAEGLLPTVPPGRPEALARAMADLLSDPGGRRRLAREGRRRVEERYGIASVARATLDAYERVRTWRGGRLAEEERLRRRARGGRSLP